jgi:hypothetical protein
MSARPGVVAVIDTSARVLTSIMLLERVLTSAVPCRYGTAWPAGAVLAPLEPARPCAVPVAPVTGHCVAM